jgi:threonine dehydratase
VAYHARRLGIPATIVMPVTTPFVKVKATEALGATVVLYGDMLAESQVRAEALARDRNLVWVHPYDDPHIIAGQGTLALEMLEDAPGLETLIVPIGGGGLIAGCAVAARGKKPSIEIVGVESKLYPSMWNATHQGHKPCGGATLAEGIAVSNAGQLTFPFVRDLVADIILVDEPLIERAVNAFLTLQKVMAEGAGAAGLAAMLAAPQRFAGRKVGLILCGGNIDPRILASIMVRELERGDRIVSFRLTIPDRPGILGHIASRLGELGANILGVDHHRLFLDVPAKGAKLDVTMETRDGAHAEEIFRVLAADGYQPVRMESGAAF